jgi:ADP-ribosylglycohydrolase
MSDVLRASVAFTGDTDTVAAIALAAAAVSREFDKDLPEVLLRNLEDGEYGKAYLQNLDRRLTDL